MSKDDKFAALGDLDHFTATDAIDAFVTDEDPKRVGRTNMTNVAKLELDRIIAKDQVRTDYDDDKHAELVASLEAHGQQQPIVVYWSEEDQKFVVFMGHRRRLAAPEAGLTSLSCVILSEPPSEAERLEVQLAENLIREDLNPIDIARGYQDLMTVRNCSARQLSQSYGKTEREIQRAVKLLTLPQEIQSAIAEGILPKSVGNEITKLETVEEQQQAFADYQGGEKFAAIAEKVKKKSSKSKAPTKPKTKKEFTYNGIKVVATAKKKFTKAELAEVMQMIAAECESDGRGKKVEEGAVAGHVAA